MSVLDDMRYKCSRQGPIGKHWYQDPYDDGESFVEAIGLMNISL